MSHTRDSSADEEELYASPMLYRLLRMGGELVLEVVVGGMAMSTVRVHLTEEESAAYARLGQAAIDDLAQRIQANPSFFGRAVSVP
jgi:hypothetical protein